MKRYLITAFGLAAGTVLAVGGAVAWTSTTSPTTYTTGAGTIKVAIAADKYTGNLVYPTSSWIEVVDGKIANNTPSNPGVPVHVTGGTISGITSGDATCNTFISGGGVTGAVNVTDSSPVAAGGTVGGGWAGYLNMLTNAPDQCQGQSLSYALTVNVST